MRDTLASISRGTRAHKQGPRHSRAFSGKQLYLLNKFIETSWLPHELDLVCAKSLLLKLVCLHRRGWSALEI